ncbi:MAG: penicillin-binding protein [Gammaproteobacteria bacterium]|nr:MAG: penicillin-binding protein [Gammaproteobacteria bacterium]
MSAQATIGPRVWLAAALVGGAFLVLAGRAWQLQVLRSDFLDRQAAARQQRVVTIPAHRGALLDRHGEPLAVSTPVESVWVDPGAFAFGAEAVARLAEVLELDAAALRRRLEAQRGRAFVYVKRAVPPQEAEAVRALGLPGVYLQREYRRYYPTAEVSAHVLGFTDIDDRGQEGLELAFDAHLAGRPGRKRVLQDRLGRVIEDLDRMAAAEPGRDLVLSLDKRLQYAAYRALKAAVQAHGATAGSLVLLDVHTGEVLAMVNQPAFNPNNRDTLVGGRYRNRAVTDVFEPGSTMKPFTVAVALEAGVLDPRRRLPTAPGRLRIGAHVIHDERNYGALTAEEVIRHSSNVGAARIALALEPAVLWQGYRRFGLGQSTGSGFPGESAGVLGEWAGWSRLEQATLAFGYGLAVTPLQLARAYAVLAAGGVARPVTFLRQDGPVPGERVLSLSTARALRDMLVSVVESGTGRRAAVTGYRVAGKTGTVRKALPGGGYSDDEHVAVFAGFAPAAAPRLAAVVVIDRPRGDRYYGGEVAAPVFAEVMADALRLLDVPPDDLPALYVQARGGEGTT